jgi:hypothetical protein
MCTIRGSYGSATSSQGCHVGVISCTEVESTVWDPFSGMLVTRSFLGIWIFGISGPLAEKLQCV